MLNKKINAIPMTEFLDVDEQMIPYCGTRGPRYYIKNKPNPWGFKNWALADTYGMIYNVDICVGATKQQDGHPDIGATGNIVLQLCKIIPIHLDYKVVMDNYFSGVPLYYELLKRGTHCFGTVKLNRVPGISSVILPDNELIARGKSSFVEYEGTMKDAEGNVPANDTQHIRVIRWYDKSVSI